MMPPNNSSVRMPLRGIVHHALLIVALAWMSGCATVERVSVRRVEFGQAPELAELAERARGIGNQVYPKILALLPDDTSKLHRRFDIVFKQQMGSNAAQTIGTKIYLNASWYQRNPDTLEVDLPHEMVHVAQQHTNRATWYWTEGLADYVCYKLGRTNGVTGPHMQATTAHYTSGYWAAGAFLLFLDRTYGPRIVQRLNVQLRRGSYSDSMFADATGKSLDELWAEFQEALAYHRPPEKLDAQVVGMQPRLLFQFLTSLLPVGGGRCANENDRM